MAKRKAIRKPKRKRRTHSEEFKREAVKLLTDPELSVAEANNLWGDRVPTKSAGGNSASDDGN